MALALFFALGSVAQARPDVIDQYVEALMTRDTGTLNRVLAENYLHINGNGYLQDKENLIGAIKNGKLRIDRLTLSDVTASTYGNTTVVTGNVHVHGKAPKGLAQGLQRVTIVTERVGDTEKIVLFQATPVRDKGEKASSAQNCPSCQVSGAVKR